MNAINELSFSDFRLLRVKTDLVPDDDYALTQTGVVDSDVAELRHPGATRAVAPVRVKVELIVEFLEGETVALGSNRGSFDLQAIRVSQRQGIAGDVITDSATIRSQSAYRPIIIDDVMAGDRFTVRITNITAPIESPAEGLRVLYREIF